MDLTETTAPRSDQQNYDDVASTPRTLTVTEVKRGSAEQPVEIHNAEFPGRPYKPNKTMRRLLVAAWGADSTNYVGRRITIYGDPEVTFGRDKTGGIKISHLSHIDKPISVSLTVTRGKRKPFTVQPLADAPTAPDITVRISAALAAFEGIGVHESQLVAKFGPRDQWDINSLLGVYQAIRSGETSVDAAFPLPDTIFEED